MSNTPIARVASSASFQTERLLLDPLLPSHATALYPQLQDERLYRFIPQDPPVSLDALENRYRALSSRRSPDGHEAWLNWAMRLRGTDVYVGTLQASVFSDRTASIAYLVFVPYQGQGFASEGLRRLVEHLTASGIQRVAAEIDTRNMASIAVVERVGFERVEMHPQADFFKGAWSDEYRYELTPRRTPEDETCPVS